MCTTCGCGSDHVHLDGEALPVSTAGQDDPHWHVHADGTAHSHAPSHGFRPATKATSGEAEQRRIRVERDLLASNDAYAAANRQRLQAGGVFALNLVSSPGAGKTTLLVRTIAALQAELPLAVIEGDQQTSLDAERIRATGAAAVQINTGKGCHLDARQVGHALDKLPLPAGGLLLVENVGNLVCPAAFDLGEAHKVVILSVTEGEDKPLKYPDMFRAADLLLLNKIDLLPHVDFNVDQAIAYARQVNPKLAVLQLSATRPDTGDGFARWLDWLRAGTAAAKALAAG